jgi:dTDP-4-dehydrorhamnose reductase
VARLLITGASGLLGATLAHLASGKHEVVAVTGRQPLQLPEVMSVAVDLSRAGQARKLIQQHQPDWVTHCAAATDLDRCEREPEWARALNVDLAREVAQACAAVGARLAHISTDSVFDGTGSHYTELDEPHPLNVYARSKLEGEREVQTVYPGALIVRTNFFGWAITPRPSLAEWFLGRLESAERTPGFSDVYFSPLVADHLAEFVLDLLRRGTAGLLHLPGATCLSKYEFGRRLATAFGHDPDLIDAASVREAALGATRPLRTCLKGERAVRELNRPLPAFADGLELLGRTRSERTALRLAQPRLEELAHESD